MIYVPGNHACVLVVNVFNPSIQEGVWLEVLSCAADDTYIGRVCAPAQRFSQLSLGTEVVFQLDHVLAMRGRGVVA